MQPVPGRGHNETAGPVACSNAPVISICTSPADFACLRREWDALRRPGYDQDPFLSCDWFAAWWRAFGDRHKLFLVTARRQGRLLGVLPMMQRRRQCGGLWLRRLSAIGNDHTPRFDLVRGADDEGLHRAVWNYLINHQREWDVLDLPCLSAGSDTADHFVRLATEHGVPHRLWAHGPCSPWVEIQPSWAAYLASRSAGFRKALRRKRRQLDALGRVDLETVTDGPALVQALLEGFQIEAEGCRGGRRTAVLSQQRVKDFYTELAQKMAGRGQLRLHFLTLDGQRIAFDFSLCSDRSINSLKAGHRLAHARFSPGTLLLALIIQSAHEERLAGIDLLGDSDEFKMHWTAVARRHRWLHCYSISWRGRLLYLIKGRLSALLRGFRWPGHLR